MTIGTALNTATKALLEVCARRGIDTDDLLTKAELNPALMEKFGGRIPADKKRLIWDEALRRAGDEQIGLCAAQIVPFGGYGVLDYLLFASSTLGEVLTRTSRFYHLINSNAEIRLETHKDCISVELFKSNGTSKKNLGLSAEYTFAILLRRFNLAYGGGLKPEKIYFTHPSPLNVSLHYKLFQSPIQFGQQANRLVFRKDALKTSLSQADAALAEMLDQHAERLLKRLPAEYNIAEQVREVLRTRLGSGDVSLNAIARTLAMSGRNLQRNLNSQGTSYRKLLDSLRYELALDYTAQQMDAIEITHRLGFTETSAFYRAFKRWTEIYS
jgi:AraC-like DNA-binding protein